MKWRNKIENAHGLPRKRCDGKPGDRSDWVSCYPVMIRVFRERDACVRRQEIGALKLLRVHVLINVRPC